jgi:hypothetical protein
MRWLTTCLLLLACPASAQETGLREVFLPQVTQEALANNIPPEIADAVAMVETGYRPSTAASLGFHGSSTELFEPSINIHLAVQYLARAWANSGGDMCRAFTKYRAGVGTEITTPLSAQYCARAIAWLKGTNSALASAATMPQAAAAPAAIDDPHVIRMVPIPASDMPMTAPIITRPQVFIPVGSMHRPTTAQLSRFESRVRTAVNQATKDSDD